MRREEIRALRRQLNKDIVQFFNTQQHYFPDLIQDIRNVLDQRHQSYTIYEIEVVLYVMILKNVCSIASMREMSHTFTEDKLVKNVYKLLGLEPKDYLPHYVTINECLSKIPPEEIEKIRKNMIVSILRKRSFEKVRLLDKYWCIVVDATQLYSRNERHCEHCLTKTYNKGTEDEKTVYYHQVLEAKIIMDNQLLFSIDTEFIENETEEMTKQDCETKAFKRLAASLKQMFPRLPICILADSLYASEPVMSICKNNGWECLIRFKSGSIPTLAKEFNQIVDMGEADKKIIRFENTYQKRWLEIEEHQLTWVNELNYEGHDISIMQLYIERQEKADQSFQWISSVPIDAKTAKTFADAGRSRWKIENEGFNTQKNHRYLISHQDSADYNASKNHYLITQIADILVQLYEYSVKGVRELHRTIKNVAKALLESLRLMELTDDDLVYKRIRVNQSDG